MSEFALSSLEEYYPNRKKIGFSSLLLSDFHLFCSFILSHPFYFSYVLFFSPYIFKILSFLSPLFVTTTLLLLALLISTLHVNDSESPETQPSLLFSFCTKLSSVLEPKFDDFISLEAYKMVVDACSSEICSDELTFVDKFCSHESTTSEASLTREEEPVEIQPLKFEDPIDMEKEETLKCEKEEQKVKPKSHEVVLDKGEGQYWKQPTTQESKVGLVGDCGNDVPKLKVKKNEEEVALRSVGSMRKEKEWRRTLACKLFEERHNADVGQGMDQLWETYETQAEKKQTEEEKKEVALVEEEDDEDGIDQQQLCCLQALKFSTGKMHLGIARPNLVKLTKAFKGFGRFYNANKHSKKA